VSRAGDYSSTSVDPVDDSFWHTNEVFTQSGSFLWNTYICEFALAGTDFNTPPIADFRYTCNELSCAFFDESTDSDGTVVAWSWTFGDGGASSGENPTHIFAADGSYNVTLRVTDDDGATDSLAQTVTVSGTPANVPPTASFIFNCTNLACGFDGSGSTDNDGTIADYAWNFGDGATGGGQATSHEYDAYGDYPVTLTVTDDLGATGTDTQTVTVAGSVELELVGTAEMTSTNKWKATVEDLNGSILKGTWSAAKCSPSFSQPRARVTQSPSTNPET